MDKQELEHLYFDLWTHLGGQSQIQKLKEELLELLTAIHDWERCNHSEECLADICDEIHFV